MIRFPLDGGSLVATQCHCRINMKGPNNGSASTSPPGGGRSLSTITAVYSESSRRKHPTSVCVCVLCVNWDRLSGAPRKQTCPTSCSRSSTGGRGLAKRQYFLSHHTGLFSSVSGGIKLDLRNGVGLEWSLDTHRHVHRKCACVPFEPSSGPIGSADCLILAPH